MNERLEAYVHAHDYEAIKEGAIQWIREWFRLNGPTSPAVLGISGGKDSTVAAALCAKALGKERVFGVLMPNGIQPDIAVSRRVVETLGIESVEVNIREGFQGIVCAIENAPRSKEKTPLLLTEQATINLSPRLRMATVYAVSQCVNGRVANTSNRSEAYVGYSTRWGDSVGDFAPLLGLTVTEVRIIGKLLGLPPEFVLKPPADGLSGHTDEDALGFTYGALDTLLLTGEWDDPKTCEKIARRHTANAFKTKPMAAYDPNGIFG